MKVPRPFSIAGGHGLAIGFGVLKRESSAGFVLANRGQPPANQRDGSLLAQARPCAHNAGRLCESRRA